MNTRNIVILILIGAAAGVLGWWWADKARTGTASPGNGAEHTHLWTGARDAAGAVYYTCPMHPQVRSPAPGNCPICGMKLVKGRPSAVNAEPEPQVLYWYDPMHPDQHFEEPGPSPFMDMPLVPKYATPEGAAGVIAIDPVMAQNLGVRTERVERGAIAAVVRAAGAVMIDETRIAVVPARADGWVERLHVRAVNDPVRRGQVLAEVYAPDLYAAQEELLLALDMGGGDAALADAARQRLSLLGVDRRQIAALESSGEAQRRVAIHAPIDGVVTVLGTREGARVTTDLSLFEIADLSRVWVTAEVPEAQSGGLAPGMPVEANVVALPGRTFQGGIDYVYPEVEPGTRTLRVRTVFPNEDLALRPGMYADVRLRSGETSEQLLVPAEALIRTGTRTAVIVAESPGRYRPVEVIAGREHDGRTEILSGLEAGQEVVASGQFLIDSEANLRAALGRLSAPEQELQPMQREGTLRYRSNPATVEGGPADDDTRAKQP
jgi:Cu(I)/Ag(I) efflux system membrane fusion protein